VFGLAHYGAHRVALELPGVGRGRMSIGAPNVDKLAQRMKTRLQDVFYRALGVRP
jgi:hypothetical protein